MIFFLDYILIYFLAYSLPSRALNTSPSFPLNILFIYYFIFFPSPSLPFLFFYSFSHRRSSSSSSPSVLFQLTLSRRSAVVAPDNLSAVRNLSLSPLFLPALLIMSPAMYRTCCERREEDREGRGKETVTNGAYRINRVVARGSRDRYKSPPWRG